MDTSTPFEVHDGHALAARRPRRSSAQFRRSRLWNRPDLHRRRAPGPRRSHNLRLHVGEAVDAGDDLRGVLAQAVEDHAQRCPCAPCSQLRTMPIAPSAAAKLSWPARKREALRLVAQEHGTRGCRGRGRPERCPPPPNPGYRMLCRPMPIASAASGRRFHALFNVRLRRPDDIRPNRRCQKRSAERFSRFFAVNGSIPRLKSQMAFASSRDLKYRTAFRAGLLILSIRLSLAFKQ